MPANKTKAKLPFGGPKSKAETSLSIPVYSLTGETDGTLSLPKELFGVEVNQKLLAQAVRVYQTNQKAHHSHTKTRGEVEGSTRKIFRQKGTGRARHGAIRAPIFVGGGIALGPKSRKVVLDLPKKMKKAALKSALSLKAKERQILAISGMDKVSGKTKEFAKLAAKLAGDKKLKSMLIVTDKTNELASRAVRNIPSVEILPANQLNTYEVIAHQMLVLTKDAITSLGGRIK